MSNLQRRITRIPISERGAWSLDASIGFPCDADSADSGVEADKRVEICDVHELAVEAFADLHRYFNRTFIGSRMEDDEFGGFVACGFADGAEHSALSGT